MNEKLLWVKIGPLFHFITNIEHGIVYAKDEGLTEERLHEYKMIEALGNDSAAAYWYQRYLEERDKNRALEHEA
jgi:hypothetical protein